MANVRSSNTWFVDSSSVAGTPTSYLSETNLRLVGVIFYTSAATDAIDLYDVSPSAVGAGSQKISLKSATTGTSTHFRFQLDAPQFANGVWVTITGTPKATLIFVQQGSN